MYHSKDDSLEMRRIRRELSEFTLSVLGKPKTARIHIGTSTVNKRKIWVNDDQRNIHMHVLGRSGQGKTYLLESMMRSDIDNRRGLCLIDPHGDLYKRVLDYCVLKRLHDKVILIDPNDTEWVVGLNYLEYNPKVCSASAHAGTVMKGIEKVFGGEKTETMPQHQRWERNALIPIIKSKLTLVELFHFIDTRDPMVRNRLTDEKENYYLAREWETFDDSTPREKNTLAASVLNRANKFVIGDTVRRIFGQRVSTVDFRKEMDAGKIILCNLKCGQLSKEEQTMLGVVLIDKMYQAGMSRDDIPESERKRMPPFYFYIDEFGNFVSEDVARALQELRKYRISLVLAHQELEQLREDSPKLYSAVMAEPDIKIVFSISYDDAQLMARSLFVGEMRGDIIKHVIEQTKFRPVESQRLIRGWAHSTGRGRGKGTGSMASVTSVPSQGFLGDLFGLNEVAFVGGDSSSLQESASESEAYQETLVPFYEYEEFMEISSVQFWSPAELLENFIAWLVNQTPMHAQLKIGTRTPIPIVTPFIKDVSVRRKDVEVFKERIYRRYAKPVAEVDKEIVARRELLLSPQNEDESKHTDPSDDDLNEPI